MAPRDGELCENCLRHLRKRHHDGSLCDKCLPETGSLRRCKSCMLIRYCSRECQKAHWKQHKQYCSANVEIQRTREALGGWIAERQRTFEKWCNKYSQSIASAALSALEIMKDRDRTETHVFLVYLDVVDLASLRTTIDKSRFDRSIREAHCVTVSEVHEMFDSRFHDGYRVIERVLAPRPRMLRILVIDDGLPSPLDLYTLPFDVEENISHWPCDRQWLKHLKWSLDHR